MVCTLCSPTSRCALGLKHAQFWCLLFLKNFFGLPLYTVMLLLGRVDREIRKSVSIAIAIGWTFVALVAMVMVVFAHPDVTATYVMWSIVAFGTWAAVLAGSLIYNQIHYGFYL